MRQREEQSVASVNFAFLREHDPLLLQLCAAAERYCLRDPNTSLLKLRQFGEALARHLAASFGIDAGPDVGQADLLFALQRRGYLDRDIAALLHALRRDGNEAAHRFETPPRQAAEALRTARTVAIWFHRAFGKDARDFNPGPFQDLRLATYATPAASSPPAPTMSGLEAELAVERARREDAERRAEMLAGEKTLWEQLAQDEERQRLELQAAFDARIAVLQAQSAVAPPKQLQQVSESLAAATVLVTLDEHETRRLIDSQLRAAGWEADSVTARYSLGARPDPGRNRAIAEWPTDSGPADYVLFVGLTPVAVVEAKKYGTDVSTVVGQAERYSLGYRIEGVETMAYPAPAPGGAPPGWPAGHATVTGATHYRVPFVFAANGRSYHRQFLTKSGVWFRDVRLTTNHACALDGWHTPEGLMRLLQRDLAAAASALAAEPFGYLNLRDYQIRAVQAVEAGIAAGRRECLVAMATGTGKTRTVIGLLYRMLKARRFHRILFLVDRKDLGTQAQDAFKGFRLEQDRLFTEVFELKELEDVTPDGQTRVHVATVQGMVRRLFGEEGEALPIDRYDCIVVDEAHRGYTLDREMGEGELVFRSEADYISAYRRVLDHFDAVKVALTATPAQHTVQIFGLPIFTYSYREAVIDGWLIDHEPPVRLVTQLAKKGIHFASGDEVTVFDGAGHAQQQVLPDELDFEIEDFNRLVITENFNRVVCEAIAPQLDPLGPAKTLVYCANDSHADLVVKLLREALEAVHGPLNDKAVMKITGRADKPSQLIRLFKNEAMPNIAVTVDLLTTGIDVPAICNLVFLRRVRSRILYEQMLGRATRLCPAIGKEAFRIFDAVDLYQALDPVSTMKPVVVQPTIPLESLLDELADPAAHETVVGTDSSDGRAITHADEVAAQLVVRLRNLLRRASGLASKAGEHGSPAHEAVAAALEQLTLLTGEEPEAFAAGLRKLTGAGLRDRLTSVPGLRDALLSLQVRSLGAELVVSPHHDELVELTTGYGPWEKPEDYLHAFKDFIQTNRNQIAALEVVLTRPRDLTRQQLRELQVILAQHNFTERSISTAWKQARNEDVAATLIGYIRQLALGSPLVPFEQRVDRALERLLKQRAWTEPQRRWLLRIAKAVKTGVVIDETTFDHGAWASSGGLKVINAVFDGSALAVARDLEDAVWSDAA